MHEVMVVPGGFCWRGVLHEVVVVPGGFCWRGETYDSLSTIARKVTGVSWNGPRLGFAGFPLSVEGVEGEVEIMLGRLAGVDGVALAPGSEGLHRQQLARSHVAELPSFLGPGKYDRI